MLARLKPLVGCAALLSTGCASTLNNRYLTTGEFGGMATLIEDDLLMLQEEPVMPLATLKANVDLSDFCDEMTTAAAQAVNPTYSISCRVNKRLVRVMRTQNNVSIVIHFVLLERVRADGSRAIGLQPAIAWKRDLGKQVTVPVRRTDATGTLNQMRPDLATFGATAAAIF